MFTRRMPFICIRAGGEGGVAGPPAPVLKNFGKSAHDSGKSTWDKLFIESGFYYPTKRSILRRFNGFAANLLIADNC